LAERNAGQGVAIADLDVFGRYGSSELNGGGVRCTFAEPINIKLSLESTRYYLAHAKQFDFRQRGYLWMYDEAKWPQKPRFESNNTLSTESMDVWPGSSVYWSPLSRNQSSMRRA
jgi:hypothetical protein